MKGLLLKDLYNMKGVIRIYIMFPFFAVFLGYMSNSLSILAAIPAFTCMIFIISAFAYDEYSHFDEYALTLPLGRKDLVKSKYVLFVLLLCVMLVIVYLLSVIVIMCFSSHFTDVHLMDQCLSILGVTAAILLIMAIQFPFIIRFGTEKARILMLVCILGIGGLCGFFLQFVDLERLFINISDMAVYMGIIIGSVLSIIIFICSYYLSLRLIMKKEY